MSSEQSIFPSVQYENARAAIAWLEKAFDAETVLVVPGEDGEIVVHSEISIAGNLVMISSIAVVGDGLHVAPKGSGRLYLVLPDAGSVDSRFDAAKAAKAEILRPMEDTDYGSHGFSCVDPEGNQWSVGTYRPGTYVEQLVP